MAVTAEAREYAEELIEQGNKRMEELVMENGVCVHDYTGARKCFERAIKFDKYSSNAHRSLGELLSSYHFKQYKEALQQFSLAIECDPNDYLAYIKRGQLYAGIGSDFDNNQYRQANLKNISKAIEDFTSAIDIIPTKYFAYYDRAKCYQELKQYEKAIEDFNEVVEFESEWSPAYSARGHCYEAWGKMDKARADFAERDRLEAIEEAQKNLRYTY